LRGTLTIPRALIPTDPTVFSVLPSLSIPAGDQIYFYTAQSQLAVRIVGQ
jgi:hypothetical protein